MINTYVTGLCIYSTILFIVRVKKIAVRQCYASSSLIPPVFTISLDFIIFSYALFNLMFFFKINLV